jgi:hypothetical protein
METRKKEILKNLENNFNQFKNFQRIFSNLPKALTFPFFFSEENEKDAIKRILGEIEVPDWTIYYNRDAIGKILEIMFVAAGWKGFSLDAIKKGQFDFAPPPDLKRISPKRMAVRLRAKQTELFLRIRAIINDFICLMGTSKSITELLPEAQKGDLKALKSILEVDKAILTAPWCQQIMRRAQLFQDREILSTIAKALESKAPVANKQHLELALFLRIYWHTGINTLSVTEIFDFLQKHGLYGQTDDTSDPESLRKFISRLKLKKTSISVPGFSKKSDEK